MGAICLHAEYNGSRKFRVGIVPITLGILKNFTLGKGERFLECIFSRVSFKNGKSKPSCHRGSECGNLESSRVQTQISQGSRLHAPPCQLSRRLPSTPHLSQGAWMRPLPQSGYPATTSSSTMSLLHACRRHTWILPSLPLSPRIYNPKTRKGQQKRPRNFTIYRIVQQAAHRMRRRELEDVCRSKSGGGRGTTPLVVIILRVFSSGWGCDCCAFTQWSLAEESDYLIFSLDAYYLIFNLGTY